MLDVILILSNQCNLNCSYCVYGCDITPFKYFITEEDFKTTLSLLKEKIPSIQRLILSGGDGLIHPKLIDFCTEARKYFPFPIELNIYTNGLLLPKYSDEQIKFLTQELHINIITSLYPSIKNLDIYKEQDKRFKQLGTELYYQSSHIYFIKTNFKNHNINLPKKMIENYYKNCRTITKYNSIITIYNYKLLTCCGEVGFLNNGKNCNTSDLLDIRTLNNEQEIYDFCEHPHDICRDCVANDRLTNMFILWQKKNMLTERYQETTLETIFVRNYEDYKKLFLEDEEQVACFKDDFFRSKFNPEVTPGELNTLNIKFINGLGDIFIPYDKTFTKSDIQNLGNVFKVPNSDKYNFYFVGINAGIKNNTYAFRYLFSHGLDSERKTYLLQSDTLLKGYEEFLRYSYLNNKILLDPQDIFNNKINLH